MIEYTALFLGLVSLIGGLSLKYSSTSSFWLTIAGWCIGLGAVILGCLLAVALVKIILNRLKRRAIH